MNTVAQLSAVNERLSLALEGSRQVAFDWSIPDDRLYFSGILSDGSSGVLFDTGKTWTSSALPHLIHDDDQHKFRTHLHAALKGFGDDDGPFYKVELRMKGARHSWRWMEISGKIAERDSSGRALRMVGTFSDIDERKQTESRIGRLRDLYVALSQTNQAIVRTNDRDALFSEICRIAVEHGRFHMAWIGLVDPASKRVVPAAAYGDHTDVFQDIGISTDVSKPEGNGVIGKAIRNNRPAICNDFFSAPNLQYCREALAQAGFRSIASFPFQSGGETIGALNLYATEKDFFDAPLIDLLEEMTRDISFAIDSHERDAQRKAMEEALADSENIKSAILSASLDCIVSMNQQGEIIGFNQAAERTFGYRSADVLGKKLADIVIPEGMRARHQRGLERFMATGRSSILSRRTEMEAMRADGTTFPIELTVVPLSVQNQPVFTAFMRDISELRQSQAVLRDSALRYRQLVELSPEAIFVYRENRLELFNQAASQLLGASDADELHGRSILDFIHPDYHALFQVQSMRSREPAPSFVEQVWMRLDGSSFHAEIGATDLMYNDAPAVQVLVRDITERKRAEALQLGQNRILSMVATGASLSDILTEIARFVESQSRRGLCSILQLNGDGTALVDRIAPSLPPAYLAQLGIAKVGSNNCSCGTSAFRGEPVMVTDIATDPLWESRRELALEHGLRACTSWPIFGKNRKLLGTFALYFRDATSPGSTDLQLFSICTNLAGIAIESRASEEKIRYLAHYDGLTSLPNRFLFKEYLDMALRNAQRRGNKFAVLFLDLDKFKEVNDTLGHDAGDLVLQEISRRLRDCIRHTDKIARMGGDEFYVLIEELTDGRHAADVAQKLLDAASAPVVIGDKECHLSVSIGIGIYPDNGSTGQELLKNADNAMYQAKDRGKNDYCFFSPQQEGIKKRIVSLPCARLPMTIP